MRTHVALLRGVNVGGHNRIRMAELSEIAESLGLVDVATYVQSGNVVFTSIEADATRLADALEKGIAEVAGIRPAVIVLSRKELAAAVAGNPYPDETNPKNLHLLVHRSTLGRQAAEAMRAAVERAKAKGSHDQGAVKGRWMYLRTPDGLGRSTLATELNRSETVRAAGTVGVPNTMRNWATVTKLMALLDE